MGTIKDDSIKFRVNKELKKEFKLYTERYNTNMSEVFTDIMVDLLEKEKYKTEHQEKLSKRSAATEIKIAQVKAKKFSCENTQKEKKFNLIFRLFKRFKKTPK